VTKSGRETVDGDKEEASRHDRCRAYPQVGTAWPEAERGAPATCVGARDRVAPWCGMVVTQDDAGWPLWWHDHDEDGGHRSHGGCGRAAAWPQLGVGGEVMGLGAREGGSRGRKKRRR